MSGITEFLEEYDRALANEGKDAQAAPPKLDRRMDALNLPPEAIRPRPAMPEDLYDEYAAFERQQAQRPSADDPEPYSRKLVRIDFGDIRPQLKASYVVKGLIQAGTLVAVNGASGSGKSFWALNIGLRVASGNPWRGHPVRRGLVIYFALEGAASAQNRVAAWRATHLDPSATLPFCICPSPINLRDPADVLAILEFVKKAEAEYGEECVLIIIDTLSRAMAGGKENLSEDMTALIAGADSIKNRAGAAVMLIHHLGKDETRGGRGHSSLKGALDTEIEISRNRDERTVLVTKQRDGIEGARHGFTLEVVEIGVDDEGDPVTSCVIKRSDAQPAGQRRRPSGKNQDTLLTALQERQRANGLGEITGRELREIAKALKLDRRRLDEAVKGLTKVGWIESTREGVRFFPEASAMTSPVSGSVRPNPIP